MSTQLKKKTKKKKKKVKPKEITFEKHEKVGNVNLYSEEIARIILEKIISLAFYESYKNYIRKKSHEICLQICKNMINNLIEINHINHDTDDFDIDKIEINSYINYNNTDSNIKRYLIKKHNIAWEKRNENAKENLIDSDNFQTKENNLNKSVIIHKNKYVKKDKIIQFSVDTSKNNFWGNIPCPKITYIDRTLVNHNIFIPMKRENKEGKIDSEKKGSKKNLEVLDKNKNFTIKKAYSYRRFVSKLYKNKNLAKSDSEIDYLGDVFKKKETIEIPDFPSYPLEDIEERKELDNIDELRNEAMELFKKKEKSTIKNYTQKLQKTRKDLEIEKKIKEGKFTYDDQGNLILINEIKQDQLTKEFNQMMSKPKDIKLAKTSDYYHKELIKMENRAKKNIEYNNYNEEDQKLGTFIKKIRATQPLININNLNDSLKGLINELNIQNKTNSPKKENEINILSLFKKKRIEPSGSNFQLINPSVGVTIKDKKNLKSGGNDFFKEFNRYSTEEYNKTLQNNSEWGKMHLLDKQKEEFNPMATTQLPNLQKSSLIKNIINTDKEENQNMTDINQTNTNFILNQKLTNQKSRNKNFEEINNSENYNFKKSMAKSTSEIVLDNDKFIKLKQILFHDKEDKKAKFNLNKNKNASEKYNLLEYKNKSSLRQRNKKVLEIRKRFNDIDNFNKNLITGNAVQQMFKNSTIILPKLSLKNNVTNFNKTMVNFVRERTKKSMWEEYIRQKEINKDKKFWKINFVKPSN